MVGKCYCYASRTLIVQIYSCHVTNPGGKHNVLNTTREVSCIYFTYKTKSFQ